MKTHLDTLEKAWRRFAAQPGNTHLALAAALLVGLALTVTLADGEPSGPADVNASAGFSDPTDFSETTAFSESADGPKNALSQPIAKQSAGSQSAGSQSAGSRPVASNVATADTVNSAILTNNRLVIILDDIGNNAAAGERAVNLPGAVTYAVLPFTPHGKMLANLAHEAGKEVMLHAPMSNLAGMALGEGGLTLALTEDEFIHTLRAAIADIPHIAGVNNHTGSELTAAEQPMQWVMRELKAQGLFFVDSMTTGNSVAAKIAVESQVPALKRHVFLDNEATPEAIDRQFQRAVDIAQQQGFAVAIGHPYPATLDYLEHAIVKLPERNITLVPASVLLTHP
jgi:polysaccharide deacetylase 2 family uncharacterized protein YibQ